MKLITTLGMKEKLTYSGQFALIYFIIFGILFIISETDLFPFSPSLIHSNVLTPITIAYIIIFFGIIYYKRKKK